MTFPKFLIYLFSIIGYLIIAHEMIMFYNNNDLNMLKLSIAILFLIMSIILCKIEMEEKGNKI